MKLCMFDMSFAVPRYSLLAADQSGVRYISSMTSSTDAPPCNPQASVASPFGSKGRHTRLGGEGEGGPWGDPILTKGQTL
jgi:hypothetical protein